MITYLYKIKASPFLLICYESKHIDFMQILILILICTHLKFYEEFKSNQKILNSFSLAITNAWPKRCFFPHDQIFYFLFVTRSFIQCFRDFLREDLTSNLLPSRIVDHRVKQLRSKTVPLVKVAWGRGKHGRAYLGIRVQDEERVSRPIYK